MLSASTWPACLNALSSSLVSRTRCRLTATMTSPGRMPLRAGGRAALHLRGDDALDMAVGRIPLFEVTERRPAKCGGIVHCCEAGTGFRATDADVEPEAALLTSYIDLDILADPNQADGISEVARALYLGPVHRDDDVAGPGAPRARRESRTRRGRPPRRVRCRDSSASARSGVRSWIITPIFPRLHLAVLRELLHHRGCDVDGNREANTYVAAGRPDDRGVDADQLAVQVHECAAGVARVDRGVGLD